jgi:hypothetical protein
MNAQQIEFPLRVAVCAWCEPVRRGAGLGEISHGICPRHLRKLERQLTPKGILRKNPGASTWRRRLRNGAGEASLPL